MCRKLILLLLCSLQTESCWPCSGTVIAQGCIILVSLSMISPDLWVIITKTGIKSFKQGPTFLAGNWAKEFPARYRGEEKVLHIQADSPLNQGPREVEVFMYLQEFRTSLDKALSSFITASAFEADLSRSCTKNLHSLNHSTAEFCSLQIETPLINMRSTHNSKARGPCVYPITHLPTLLEIVHHY